MILVIARGVARISDADRVAVTVTVGRLAVVSRGGATWAAALAADAASSMVVTMGERMDDGMGKAGGAFAGPAT